VERARRVPGSAVTDSRFQMQAGQAEVEFKPSSPKGSRFEIRTGFAAAAVRGTEFRIAASERATRTEVVEGTIAFTGIPAGGGAAGEAVAVPAGFGSIVDETRRPSAPAQLLNAPILPQPRVIQFAPVLQLRFPALAGAVNYRVRLAADEGFDSVLRESVQAQPLVNLADLAPGAYVLKVRAIDRLGLEGREASVPVRLIAGKPTAAPAPAAVPDTDAGGAPAPAPGTAPSTPAPAPG
jgi:hypothetical protein